MCSDVEPSLQLGANSQSQTYRNEEAGVRGKAPITTPRLHFPVWYPVANKSLFYIAGLR